MKKQVLIFLMLFLASLPILSQNCTNCNNPTPFNDEKYSSVVGKDNQATGYYSFAGGENSTASGTRSFAFGNAVIVEGTNAVAFGPEAYAKGNFSIALGPLAETRSGGSIAIGSRVKSSNSYSMIIGKGVGSSKLDNPFESSLMIGFNSINPTLFVSKSENNYPATVDKTGKVGIGNMTNPQHKLHIRSDEGEPASMLIQPHNFYAQDEAFIYLGNETNSISAHGSDGLQFRTFRNFSFLNGRVGIGTTSPAYTLDVNGNVNAMKFIGDGSQLTGIDASPWNETNQGINYAEGSVSIGNTEAGPYTLAVAGPVLSTEVTVLELSSADWPDYVFADDYKLKNLEEVKAYVAEHQHLPEVPSAEQVAEEGIKLGEMNAILLKKIEELTLYAIQQQEMLDKQQQQIDFLKSKLED